MQVEQLWKEYGKKFVKNSFFNGLAIQLATKSEIFKGICWTLLNKEDEYQYLPKFGKAISVKYDWKNLTVEVERGEKYRYSLKVWIEFLNLVDQILVDILPLNTVITLDVNQIPEEIKEQYSDLTEYRFSIIRQRAGLNDSVYADYLITPWPNGLLVDTIPIPISTHMVKDVISKGYSDQIEEEYIFRLKQEALEKHKHSMLFDTLRGFIDEN